MSIQALEVPIRLTVGVNKKKSYYLNLNSYRNWQFQLNNTLKKTFKLEVAEAVRQLQPIVGKCRITYTIYYLNKRAFDIDNIGSIIAKFTNDALVEFGILEDDSYHYVPEIVFKYGGVDKNNPHCNVMIEEIADE